MVLEFIPKFEGRRVRIVYDQTHPAISLAFHHILPEFKNKRLIIAVYSDSMCRKLREHYDFISKHSPNIAKILDKAYFVKVGRKDSVPFGRIYEFIPEDTISKEFERLEISACKLREEDIVFVFGFHLMFAIYGRWIFRKIIRIFDLLPERITLISISPYGLHDYSTSRTIDKFFDVVIRIVKEEEPLDFGQDIYIIGVEESVTREIKPGFERFKILPDGRLSKL